MKAQMEKWKCPDIRVRSFLWKTIDLQSQAYPSVDRSSPARLGSQGSHG